MKKLFFLINLFVVSTIVHSQNLDSLFNEYLRIKGVIVGDRKVVNSYFNNDVKCGFGVVNLVRENFERFTLKQKIILSQLVTRPKTDTSVITSSGKFRIHFNKTGLHSPKYDLREFVLAVDSAYNFEVNILNYPPPPNDFGEGGDEKYDIYIQNLSGGLYGYTESETEIGNRIYTSYIVIDNDFSDTYTKGINGAKVSIAHELHHAIQIGNYILRNEDQFFHELTSTSMEEFVFDNINDYYSYLPSFFNNPQRAFPYNNGYNLAIWNIFLKNRFGFDIIKRSWELLRTERALNAIADAIFEYGSTFKNEFALFGQWIFFTNYRTVPNKYFKEAENYPLIKPLIKLEFTSPSTMTEINTEPVSTNFLFFINNNKAEPDTFVAIISNADITQGVEDLNQKLNLKYILSDQNSYDFKKIIDNYFSKIECNNSFLIAESYILNNKLINEGQISTSDIVYAFPQPFTYSKDDFIYFPAIKTKSGYANLFVYSVDMDLIYTGEHKIYSSDKTVVKWDALTNEKKKLSSGVYFYIVKSGENVTKGKFVIIND